MGNLLEQENLNLPDNKADLKLYGVNTDGTPSDGQFSASDLLEDAVSNIPSLTHTIPNIDWTGTLEEYARIWNAINAGGSITVNDNQQIYYKTKRIVYETIAQENNYRVIIRRWREEKKYPAETVLGASGNLALNFSTSNLALEYEESYDVVDGQIVNGITQDLGTVNNIATSVNSLTEVLYPQQNEILFQSNTDQAWIYVGNLEQIGQGVTTLLSEYLELEPNSSTEVESFEDTIKVFDVNGDAKFSSDFLIQDSESLTFSKDLVTGSLKGDVNSPEYLLSPIHGTNEVNLLKDNVVVSTIDLTPYLDDTNLARITQGVLDAQTGIVTFTRDDSSTFNINLSELIDIQVQSDFSVTDVNAPDFIKNKPVNLSDFTDDIGASDSLNPRTVYLDNQIGNDATAIQGSPLKPFQNLSGILANITQTSEEIIDVILPNNQFNVSLDVQPPNNRRFRFLSSGRGTLNISSWTGLVEDISYFYFDCPNMTISHTAINARIEGSTQLFVRCKNLTITAQSTSNSQPLFSNRGIFMVENTITTGARPYFRGGYIQARTLNTTSSQLCYDPNENLTFNIKELILNGQTNFELVREINKIYFSEFPFYQVSGTGTVRCSAQYGKIDFSKIKASSGINFNIQLTEITGTDKNISGEIRLSSSGYTIKNFNGRVIGVSGTNEDIYEETTIEDSVLYLPDFLLNDYSFFSFSEGILNIKDSAFIQDTPSPLIVVVSGSGTIKVKKIGYIKSTGSVVGSNGVTLETVNLNDL